MNKETLNKVRCAITAWMPCEVPADIPHGDMPGDKVQIGAGHIQKTNTIFPVLLPMLEKAVQTNDHGRVVISVSGGSGVGKSETASLLTYYLRQIGVGAYTMSGDNYPRRIPMYNDAERSRIFRVSGVRGLVDNGQYSAERGAILKELQQAELDADRKQIEAHPWLEVYQREGRNGLAGYLGTDQEQDFDEITNIVSQFKNGAETIWLKRMGRTDTEIGYEKVDFSEISVLVIEWTHGNSRNFRGVDIPILLNSTPQETREHRRLRNRDGKTDSAFTTMVLEIEQKLLESQADSAKIIVSKAGEILTYQQYRQLMALE